MRKTKIVCTLGPACNDEATLEKDVCERDERRKAELSHGTHEEHQSGLNCSGACATVCRCRQRLCWIPKAPRSVSARSSDGATVLKNGDPFILTVRPVVGTAQKSVGDV